MTLVLRLGFFKISNFIIGKLPFTSFTCHKCFGNVVLLASFLLVKVRFYTHPHTRVYIYIYVCVCVCVYMCVCVCVCIHEGGWGVFSWFVGCSGLWHINLCWIFNAKYIFIRIISSISNNSVKHQYTV